ncbi:hypothetical protein Dda_1574 [Drechslerella dactyloides]|uniref:Antifreeze protein n=1 Tax=Drechslerella dactyloides TaxID=74499 RepID=A0AAD6J2P7_DREDA|nr:hypothetical protein Dda_1574 [Drechslerella dactyloides]
MLFNHFYSFFMLAFAATSLAACAPAAKTCSALQKAASSKCASLIASKKIKYLTCTVWKTAVPARVTKTMVVSLPKATVSNLEVGTATVDETSAVSVFSTVTDYQTTVVLEEATVATTDTETLVFSETATVTDTSIIYNYGFALRRRATPCTSIPGTCSCLLTKTITKTLNAMAATITTTKTLPRETVTNTRQSTVSVTIITTITTIVVDSITSTETEFSTSTITVPETTQTSVTNTETATITAIATLYTCVDPNRARCGNYCYRTQIDWYNCGGCGQRCNNGQICNGGRCIS